MFYSIKEVAAEVGVTEPTLRYWETVFRQLSPKKGANGVRRYTAEDVKVVRVIYNLVKERGMTLSGAKNYLRSSGGSETVETNSEVIDRLKAIREELLGIKSALDFL